MVMGTYLDRNRRRSRDISEEIEEQHLFEEFVSNRRQLGGIEDEFEIIGDKVVLPTNDSPLSGGDLVNVKDGLVTEEQFSPLNQGVLRSQHVDVDIRKCVRECEGNQISRVPEEGPSDPPDLTRHGVRNDGSGKHSLPLSGQEEGQDQEESKTESFEALVGIDDGHPSPEHLLSAANLLSGVIKQHFIAMTRGVRPRWPQREAKISEPARLPEDVVVHPALRTQNRPKATNT